MHIPIEKERALGC